MLTDSAFNALLKTLEEPPEYVVFILGTTEVQKLPATILSRCLRFDFKLISNESLENHIKNIFKDSKIKYEDEAVSLIAKLGQGSVRDALSIADMCVAFTDKNVTYNSVVEAVGTTDNVVLNNLAKSILNKDSAMVLDQINEIAKSGKNLAQLSKDLVSYFRDIAVVKTCKNYVEILKYPSSIIAQLEDIAKNANNDYVLSIMSTLGSLEQSFRYTQNPRSLFEISVLGLLSNDCSSEIARLEKRVAELERQLAVKGDRAMKITRDPEILVEPKLNFFDEKEIWGKLLIKLRTSNEFQLYLMCEKLKYSMDGNVLSLSAYSDEYKVLVQQRSLIEEILKQIDKKIKLNLIELEKTKEFNLVEFLRQEFGNKLEIIEGDK
jgi:DNA polymerase III gamma/tau subunit